jgi:PPK2 family polyphosphate:nucleotide phosphotransferase
MAYAYIVKPDSSVSLNDFDPAEHGGLKKEEAEALHAELGKKVEDLQELMYAASKNSLLIVLQGIDTSGKDGSVRSILNYVNVQSCRVESFKQPTPLEASHDFLWRIHAKAPGAGGMTIFNRSHYEDVLVVRVHDLVPKSIWKRRYEQINQFEQMLADSGTIILKFFLHISKDEQQARLLAREDDADKSWKLSVADWSERELWKEYEKAYADALEKCSTNVAPWHVIPANHKWFRDLAIMQAIERAMKPYKEEWHDHLKKIGVERKKELEAYRQKQKK